MDLGVDQAVIEETEEIAEDETVEKSLREIDRIARTGQAEVIDQTESIVLKRQTVPIALRKATALSDRIDSTDLIIPVVDETGKTLFPIMKPARYMDV